MVIRSTNTWTTHSNETQITIIKLKTNAFGAQKSLCKEYLIQLRR